METWIQFCLDDIKTSMTRVYDEIEKKPSTIRIEFTITNRIIDADNFSEREDLMSIYESAKVCVTSALNGVGTRTEREASFNKETKSFYQRIKERNVRNAKFFGDNINQIRLPLQWFFEDKLPTRRSELLEMARPSAKDPSVFFQYPLLYRWMGHSNISIQHAQELKNALRVFTGTILFRYSMISYTAFQKIIVFLTKKETPLPLQWRIDELDTQIVNATYVFYLTGEEYFKEQSDALERKKNKIRNEGTDIEDTIEELEALIYTVDYLYFLTHDVSYMDQMYTLEEKKARLFSLPIAENNNTLIKDVHQQQNAMPYINQMYTSEEEEEEEDEEEEDILSHLLDELDAIIERLEKNSIPLNNVQLEKERRQLVDKLLEQQSTINKEILKLTTRVHIDQNITEYEDETRLNVYNKTLNKLDNLLKRNSKPLKNIQEEEIRQRIYNRAVDLQAEIHYLIQEITERSSQPLLLSAHDETRRIMNLQDETVKQLMNMNQEPSEIIRLHDVYQEHNNVLVDRLIEISTDVENILEYANQQIDIGLIHELLAEFHDIVKHIEKYSDPEDTDEFHYTLRKWLDDTLKKLNVV